MNLTLLNQYDFLPRFYRLAGVNILSNLMIPLAGLISVAFLGHLTEIDHLAGVLLSTIPFNATYIMLSFLRMSTTGLTAQAVGRDDREAMLLVGLQNALIAVGLGGLILIAQSPLRELWFALLSATPEVRVSAEAYFNARIWGAPAVLLNFVLIGWFLGRQMSGKVLLLSVVGNIANILLDYWLIVRWDWGSTGAGISQASSQYLMLFLGMILAGLHHKWKEIGAVARQLLDLSALKSTSALNGELLGKTLIVVLTFSIFYNQGSSLGTTIFSENSLIMQIAILAAYFIEGVGYATETLTGIFKGQEASEKLMLLVGIATGTSLVVGLTFALPCVLFPQAIFGLLTNHGEVTESISIYVPWLLILLGFISIAFTLDGYFVGLTEGYTLRNVTLVALGVGFAPIAVAANYFHSNHLLWLALSMFMATRAVTLGVQLPRTLWK